VQTPTRVVRLAGWLHFSPATPAPGLGPYFICKGTGLGVIPCALTLPLRPPRVLGSGLPLCTELGAPLPHLRRDYFRPLPHLCRDWAVPCNICSRGLRSPLATTFLRMGSPVPHLHRDYPRPLPHLHRDWASERSVDSYVDFELPSVRLHRRRRVHLLWLRLLANPPNRWHLVLEFVHGQWCMRHHQLLRAHRSQLS
jgi:hypothetical protein